MVGRHMCAFLLHNNRIAYFTSSIPDPGRGFLLSLLKRKTMQPQPTIRLSLPSKGRLESDSLDFLSAAGLRVFKPNPRQYQAEVPALPELGIIFQRPADIVVSVRQGSVDFGITGIDVLE